MWKGLKFTGNYADESKGEAARTPSPQNFKPELTPDELTTTFSYHLGNHAMTGFAPTT